MGNPFADLIPAAKETNSFADLIPKAKPANEFSDLIPVPNDPNAGFGSQDEGARGQFNAALARMMADANMAGHNVPIASGQRTIEQQAALYAKFKAGKGNPAHAPTPDAPHVRGVAADLGMKDMTPAARAWVHQNAAKYGLRFPMLKGPRPEPWHVQLDESASRVPVSSTVKGPVTASSVSRDVRRGNAKKEAAQKPVAGSAVRDALSYNNVPVTATHGSPQGLSGLDELANLGNGKRGTFEQIEKDKPKKQTGEETFKTFNDAAQAIATYGTDNPVTDAIGKAKMALSNKLGVAGNVIGNIAFGPGEKGYAGTVGGVAGGTAAAPFDIAADVVKFADKGEWQAGVNILVKTGAFMLPLKGATKGLKVKLDAKKGIDAMVKAGIKPAEAVEFVSQVEKDIKAGDTAKYEGLATQHADDIGISPQHASETPVSSAYSPEKSGRLLYREGHPNEFMSNDVALPGKFFSDNPDLAIGQGDNKGILYEVRFKDEAKITEHAKPGTGINGKEYVVGSNQGTGSGHAPGYIEAFTVKPGVALPKDMQLNLDRFSAEGPKQAWIKTENPDGSVRYQFKHPATESTIAQPVAPVEAPVTPKPVRTRAPKPKPAGESSISHEDMAVVRSKYGWTPREATPKPDADLIKEAQAHAGKEMAIADQVISGGRNLSDSESVALGARINRLDKEMSRARKADDMAAYDLAETEANKLVDATEQSGSRQGQDFRARQFIIKHDYTEWGLKRKALKNNMGLPLTDAQDATREVVGSKIALLEEKKLAESKVVAETIKSDATAATKASRTSPEERRLAAINTLRSHGLPTVEKGAESGGLGGGARKRSGAIPDFVKAMGADDKVRSAIKSLVKTYYETGAKDLQGVLDRMAKDLPGLSEESHLALLSDKYRQLTIESNIARLQANRFLRNVQKHANEAAKPAYKIAANAVLREMSSAQRAVQTAYDAGATMIQGHKILAVSPKILAESTWEGLKMIPHINTEAAFDAHYAKIQAHPLYSRAVKAGTKFAERHGENEFYGEGLITKFPGVFKSEAMFNAFRNEARMRLFAAFAKNIPDDAAQMKTMADMVNVLTGTAVGKPGEVASKMGGIFYAPSYEVSKWQYMIGHPLTKAIKEHGIKSEAAKQAMIVYAKNIGIWTAGVALAKGMMPKGYTIDTDPRSTDFGKLTLKSGLQIDLFGKSGSPAHTLAAMFYGNISRKGEWTDPGSFNAGAVTAGRYVLGKVAPLPGLAVQAATNHGQRYNFDTEQNEDITPRTVFQDMVPLGIKGIFQGWDKVSDAQKALLFLELFGMQTGQRKGYPKGPPATALPPGWMEALHLKSRPKK